MKGRGALFVYFPLCPTRFLAVADIRLHRSDSSQIRNRRSVPSEAHGVRIAHAEAYILRRIVADVLDHGRERRIARFECISTPKEDPTSKLAQGIEFFYKFTSEVGVPIGADWGPTVL